MAKKRSKTTLLIVFTNLSRFSAQSLQLDDVEIADALDDYYDQVKSAAKGSGGRVVKFIGDGALLVFPEDRVDEGVDSLLLLKHSIDDRMKKRGWECRFAAKAHFGTAIAGLFEGPEGKQYDIIGKDVNTAAMLDSTGVTLSVEAFRKLGKELRTRFKKHTPPITYLRVDDSRPFRWKRGRPVHA